MFVEMTSQPGVDVAAMHVEHGVRRAVERAGAPEPTIRVAELSRLVALELGRVAAVEDHGLSGREQLVDPRVRRSLPGCRLTHVLHIMATGVAVTPTIERKDCDDWNPACSTAWRKDR